MRLSFWERKANEASVELEKLLSLQGLLPQEQSMEKDGLKTSSLKKNPREYSPRVGHIFKGRC